MTEAHHIRRHETYRDRVDSPGPKRLLSIDGGGIRGLISIEILERIETLLREAYGQPELVLADYFDYVGGTSTGAIIATGISLGMTMDDIRGFYLHGAKVMLQRAWVFQRLRYQFRADRLTAALRERLGDTRLGDPGLEGIPPVAERKAHPLRTLLLLVMYRCDTDSPWPLSNNPKAKYNRTREEDGNNIYLPLWKLIRASTAAPTYFDPEEVIVGKQKCIFIDGAITPYNNPSFLLYTMATLEPYNLKWQRGEDRMLLVSVGTGSIPNVNKNLRKKHMNLLYYAGRVPSALIYANTVEADKLCRIYGRSLLGDKIDSEIGDLLEPLSQAPTRTKDFLYARYDPDLTEMGLTKLGLFPRIKPEDVLPLISGKHVNELREVGKTYARNVSLEHFGPFVPASVSA